MRVTLKTAKDIPDLRNKTVGRIIEAAVFDANSLTGFRVLHRAVERDRLVRSTKPRLASHVFGRHLVRRDPHGDF